MERSSPTRLLLLVLLLLFPARIISSQNPDHEINKQLETDAEIRRKLAIQPPVGVRKLSTNEGEKFWLEDWRFSDAAPPPHQRQQRSISHLQAPYALHANQGLSADDDIVAGLFPGLYRMMKRGFQCPAGSYACTTINRPNSCCGQGSTCQIVPDTAGLGDVGCCPGSNANCVGGLTSCNEGQESCLGHPGGGCCIAEYSCVDQGCVRFFTTVITPTPTQTPPPLPPPLPPTTTSSSSDVITTTAAPTTTTARSTSSPTSESGNISPPFRLTSDSLTTTATGISAGCPTGFYACSAVYNGGCCRTGRDCNPTSCPVITSTTIVNSNGVTIVVPVSPTGTAALGSGRCADGWTVCPDEVGGGCCPDGFKCGQVDCTLTSPTSTETAAKVPARNATPAAKRIMAIDLVKVLLFSSCSVLLF